MREGRASRAELGDLGPVIVEPVKEQLRDSAVATILLEPVPVFRIFVAVTRPALT